MSDRTRGLAVLALVLGATLAGCSDLPEISEAQAAACADLVEALPDPLAGQELTSSDERTAAWGAIELTCGVESPEAYDEYSPCIEIAGVGWFVPESELEDLAGDTTATALTTTPYVALHVPGEDRSTGVDQVLTELADPLTDELEAGEPCR